MRKDNWGIVFMLLLGLLAGMLIMHAYDQRVMKMTTGVNNPVSIGDFPPQITAGVCSLMGTQEYTVHELQIAKTDVDVVEATEPESLGEFRITYYCCCEQCCGQWTQYCKTSTGVTPQAHRTVAVDPEVIPLGTHLIIWGEEYIAEDTGAFSGNTIDIYLDDHNQGWALAHERGDYAEVFIKEE